MLTDDAQLNRDLGVAGAPKAAFFTVEKQQVCVTIDNCATRRAHSRSLDRWSTATCHAHTSSASSG